MKHQISIIGCGWLGLPLAKTLIDQGFTVKGSTTSQQKLDPLRDVGIDAYCIQLDEDGIIGDVSKFLTESESVVINIPPGLRKHPNKNHVAEIQQLISAIESSTIKNVIYISATSVFEDETSIPVITSSTLPNASSVNGKQLIEIENKLKENTHFNTTIIRFGGLFDEQRHPGNHLAGRNNLSNPDAPINLIHQQDCINIISLILKDNVWNTALNAAYPEHPTKKDYYTKYCQQHQLAVPIFDEAKKSKGKIIENKKLEHLLRYTFKHGL